MKRFILIALCAVILATLPACSNNTPVKPSETVILAEPIKFTDEAFESKVRKAMTRAEGDITKEEAAAVTILDLSNQSFDKKDGDIKDIGDIKYFIALEDLNLSFNQISDLTPLADIQSLKTLTFSGITANDLTPLKDLTNMVCIVFCWNYNESFGIGFENLDALSNMKNLEHIDAKNAGIKDISALAHLTKLWDIQLCDNQIKDITPIAELNELKIVLLDNNPITNTSLLKKIYDDLDS